jgi:uncharacterized DUF497 family protein
LLIPFDSRQTTNDFDKQGVSLEELDEIFEAKNPRKASTAVKKLERRTIVGADGKVEDEVREVGSV